MKKKLLSALFFAIGLGSINAQMIEDFETGMPSVSDLTFRNQNSIHFNILNCDISPLFGSNFNPAFTAYNMTAEKASVVTDGNLEPILLANGISQNVVGPNGGKYAIRINDTDTPGQDITSFEQTFVPKNEYLSFDYMLALHSGHTNDLSLQPFFTARLLDSNDNIIPNSLFCIVADPAEPILINNGSDLFYTKGWYCGFIKIPKEYMGKEIKVQFVVADCGKGGDRGVAYIDNIANDKKCSNPEYGYIDLNFAEFKCSPKKVTVCGTYSPPANSSLNSLQLTLLQNGVPVAINPGAITLTTVSGGTFCFDVNFGAAGIPLSGGYEFMVTGTFTSMINGYVYTLTDQSVNIGNDVSFGGGAPVTTYIDFTNETISWPAVGGPYHLEYTGDTTCCPGAGPGQPADDGIIHSTTTNNTSVSFYEGIGLTQRKCLRFRIRTECGSWSEWCCITSYSEEEGGYVITTPGESFDCTDEVNLLTLQARSAQVYPNATTGNITIKNSNSTNFELYDYNNTLVLNKRISQVQEEVTLDLSNLKQGIYILKTDKGHSIKVIKN